MPTSLRRLRLAAALGLVLVASACTPSPGPHPGELVGTWTLARGFGSPEQPYIAFVQDNTWSASDGCNRVQGTWDLRRGRLTTTVGPQTLMACDGAQLPLAVIMASHAEVEGDSLRLFSSYDSTVTELVRSTDRRVGPLGFPIGYWVERNTSTSPFLSIAADRTFTGSDGCNAIFGSWDTTDDTTQFTDVGMTRKGCTGVDQWLSGLAVGRVAAGVMTVQSADGTVIGQLTNR